MNKKNMIQRCLAITFYGISTLFIFLRIYFVFSPTILVSTKNELVLSSIIIFALLTATIFMVFSSTDQKKRRIIIKCSSFILYIYYLFTLIYMLFFDKYFGRIYDNSFYISFDYYLKNHTNFIPFATIIDYFNCWRNHTTNLIDILTNIIGNLLAFAPIGIFLPILFERMKKPLVFISTVGISIVFVETMQLITLTGSCDIDDFILNLFGAILAFVFVKSQYIQKLLKRIYL